MYWFRRMFRKQQTERQLDSELRFHLEQRAAELAEAGLEPEEARRRARIEFGGVEGIKEECRESRRVNVIETLLQDIRYGLRMMRRSPGFTTVAILTLALGVGANTAMYSVVKAVLLDPLPYKNPDELMIVRQGHGSSITYPNFLDWQRNNHSFKYFALFRSESFNLTGTATPEHINGWMVSADLFPIFDAKPFLGRLFRADEDRLGAPPVAILSEALWRQEFESDPNILGKNLTLSGHDYTIIGVLPASFRFLRGRTLYLPIGQWSEPNFRARHGGFGTTGIGRLNSGITTSQARADLNQIASQLAQSYPNDDSGLQVDMASLKTTAVGGIQRPLLILFGAVGFVLLIACANIANLLLARATARTREFAVRAALGGSRSRLIRQLLTETTLLGLAGGLLGLALAAWGTRALISAVPFSLPNQGVQPFDPGVWAFAILLSVFSGLLFGLAPALTSPQVDVQKVLRDGRGATHGRQRTQKILVSAEVAAAMVLLVGAALLLQTLRHIWEVKPGFNPENLLTFSIGLSAQNTQTAQRVRLALDKATSEVERLPGVDSAAVLFGNLPLTGDSDVAFYRTDQPRPATQNDMSGALWYATSPDYLNAMGTPLVEGRFFDSQDTSGSLSVAVIDEDMARSLFHGEYPIGKQLHLEFFDHAVTIVGVVGHVKHFGLDVAPSEGLPYQIYIPYTQIPDRLVPLLSHYVTGVVRTKTPPGSMMSAIQQRILAVDNQQVIYGAQTMDDLIRESLANRSFAMLLLSLFASIALGLASVGIYGVISYVVGQRTHEIGIRMAIGAQRRDVLKIVLAGGMRPVFVGVVAGLALVWPFAGLLSAMLFGVKPGDPATLAVVALLLTAVGLMACWIPARRAMRVEPTIALRYE
jgi:predicted permease